MKDTHKFYEVKKRKSPTTSTDEYIIGPYTSSKEPTHQD